VAGYVARTALGGETAPVPLAAGGWSTAYALTIAGRAMVLRVNRYGGDFAKDEAVSAIVVCVRGGVRERICATST
jgi:hygromycin-B 4-O-kinase